MITTSNPSQQTEQNHEIIFPKGEFWSDEPPLETYLHLTQIILLLKSLEWLWQDREDYFAAGNLTINGELVPSPEEAANQAENRLIQERQQKEYEQQQKELALQKIEQLQQKLRELGVNPEE